MPEPRERDLAMVDRILAGFLQRELEREQDFVTYGFSVTYQGRRVDPADLTVYKPTIPRDG